MHSKDARLARGFAACPCSGQASAFGRRITHDGTSALPPRLYRYQLSRRFARRRPRSELRTRALLLPPLCQLPAAYCHAPPISFPRRLPCADQLAAMKEAAHFNFIAKLFHQQHGQFVLPDFMRLSALGPMLFDARALS